MGEDKDSIDQARRTARQVSEWLSGAVGEKVGVMPMVVVPGWMVDQTVARASVVVLNPKQIGKYCAGQNGVVSENLQRRICFQLEQKCKFKTEE